MKKNFKEKFLATEHKIIKQRKAGYYQGKFSVPEARSVLTQVYCCHEPGGDRPQEIGGKRSRIELARTENTAADKASTLHHKLICNWFNLSLKRLFLEKMGPTLSSSLSYLVGRVGNLSGWLRSRKNVR